MNSTTTEDSISAVLIDAPAVAASAGGWSQDLVLAKVAAMVVLGVASFLLGALPLKLSSALHLHADGHTGGKSLRQLVVSLLLCFGGGVLIFTTFVHLQPEVRLGFEQLTARGLLPDTGHSMPLAELVFCGGFFFVYLVEELVHAVMDRRADDGPGDEAVLHRTMSLRRCSRHHDHGGSGPQAGTIIPRVSLSTATRKAGDEGHDNVLSSGESTGSSISASTQGLLNNSSSLSTILVTDSSAPTKSSPLDAGARMTGGRQPHRHPRSHHHHHHQPPADPAKPGEHGLNTVTQSLRGLIAVLALSFHAVFEGLAVGLETNVTNVWYLFAAIASHKLVIAFCVGAELVSSRTRRPLLLAYLAMFAAVTPLGVGVGILLQRGGGDESGVVALALQGMAGGTLMYVVFFEVLQRERANTQSGVAQLAAIVVGFLAMFGLQILIGHDHSGGHGHDHEGHDHHDHDAEHQEPMTTLAAMLASAASEAVTSTSHTHH